MDSNQKFRGPDISINLDGLVFGWSKITDRLCSACGEEIPEDEVPFLLWRGKGENIEGLQFHWNCATARMNARAGLGFAE